MSDAISAPSVPAPVVGSVVDLSPAPALGAVVDLGPGSLAPAVPRRSGGSFLLCLLLLGAGIGIGVYIGWRLFGQGKPK